MSIATVTTANGKPDTSFGKTDAYRIDCSKCGPVATYSGYQFTRVEARRHEMWCNGDPLYVGHEAPTRATYTAR